VAGSRSNLKASNQIRRDDDDPQGKEAGRHAEKSEQAAESDDEAGPAQPAREQRNVAPRAIRVKAATEMKALHYSGIVSTTFPNCAPASSRSCAFAAPARGNVLSTWMRAPPERMSSYAPSKSAGMPIVEP
jgi:hypothetical protein